VPPARPAEQRRLAAIVVADVAGYSRLMGRDESGTLQALRTVRREIVDPAIAAHGGRLVKTTGDGLLIEFASVVDAVRAMVGLQRALATHNASLPEERRLLFRIGVNLGDILSEDGDIFGDGVNVAARLQAIAPPGGLCLAGRVHEEVRDRLDLAFEDGGAQTLKNIARPVHVWRWSPDGPSEGASAAPARPAAIEPAEMARALAGKPSIAVLPFRNLSGDPEQDYFTDGVTEDIITALARFHELRVAARSSSFAFKARAPDIREIARQLGVQYVLAGSMRRAANRIRVTGELTNAETGLQVWTDRYDRDLADIFDLQADIGRTVAAVVEPAVRGAEIERARRKPTDSLSAYDLYLRALPPMWAGTREEIPRAIELLRQSLAHDPESAPTLATLSWCLFMAPIAGVAQSRELWDEAWRLARRAVERDAGDAFAQAIYAQALSGLGDQHEQGVLHAEEAVRLNPSLAVAWGALGYACNRAGDFTRGVESLELAVRLGPADAFAYFSLTGLSAAHFALGRHDEGIAWARKAVQRNPGYGTAHRLLAAHLVLAGRVEEAREVTRRRDVVQRTTLGEIRALRLFRQPDILDRYLAAQRACGVAE
jgi:adenylate cyclase